MPKLMTSFLALSDKNQVRTMCAEDLGRGIAASLLFGDLSVFQRTVEALEQQKGSLPKLLKELLVGISTELLAEWRGLDVTSPKYHFADCPISHSLRVNRKKEKVTIEQTQLWANQCGESIVKAFFIAYDDSKKQAAEAAKAKRDAAKAKAEEEALTIAELKKAREIESLPAGTPVNEGVKAAPSIEPNRAAIAKRLVAWRGKNRALRENLALAAAELSAAQAEVARLHAQIAAMQAVPVIQQVTKPRGKKAA